MTQTLMEPPAPPTDEPPTNGGGGGGLVRVTVNLTPRAAADLQRLADGLQMSRTDVMNRAVQVYALVEELMKEGGGHLTLLDTDGRPQKIYIV